MATPEKHWLHALYDPMIGLSAVTSNMCIADVYADGDFKLIVGDDSRKLKVYKGGAIHNEQGLLGDPAAICSYYSDTVQPHTPAIAVASGSYIFIYRNLRPYYKFTLPACNINPLEKQIWEDMANGAKVIPEAAEALTNLREQGVKLTTQSSDLLAMDSMDKKEEYVARRIDDKLVQIPAVTCMTKVNKSMAEWDSVSCLVIGTTASQILILDPKGSKAQKAIQLPSVPAFIGVTGLYDVEYRIVVAAQNGCIYSIKNGELMRNVIEMESQISSLLLIEKSIIASCMDKTIHSYHIKGKKNWSLTMSHHITSLVHMDLKRSQNSHGFLAVLGNGEIRLYNEKNLISTIETPCPISGLCFGPFGREEAALSIIHKNGGLSVKMLKRTASFESSGQGAGPPPEQDIPLNIPKKTKLYVEQTQRERDQAIEMHRIFQKDLCKLRLTTARSYVKILSDGQGPTAYSAGAMIRLNAQVQGMGPFFKIKLKLQNASRTTACNIPVAFHFNHELYQMKQSLLTVPILLPSVQYEYDVDVQSLSDIGTADDIYVFVCEQNSCIPLVSAIVNMPISEPLEF